ncbi:hypothetical protein HMPREF2864_07750 [Staphylococcus sp. HMSC059F04]|nr:hypothetical protein HMPREF2864_07750 [Staphylococcus sp. HMSC059F04]OHQ46255.1 hypothetical protein HMPREF2689_10625 [Staphylococcus sp. HMSC070D07]
MLIRSIYGETPEGAVPVEDRGPNKEKCEKHFVKQSKLGWGPNKEKCEKHLAKQGKLGWAPTDRLSKRKPSDKASWGD